jgi:hypothetical protein
VVVRRPLLFALAFAGGYRVGYLVVDTVGGAALRFPWKDSPRLLAGGAGSMVKDRITVPVRERMAKARAAVDEGRDAMRRRETELRAENGLRRSSSSGS